MNFETNGISRILFAVGTMICVSGCGDNVTPAPNPATPGTQAEMGRPPKPPENASLPDGPGAVFAMSFLRLGRNGPTGAIDSNLWKTFGYNLDSTVTMRSSAGVLIGEETCTRLAGSSVNATMDGELGRDNAFGFAIMPLAAGINKDVEKSTNQLILAGNHTILLELPGLGMSPAYTSMPAQLFETGAFVDAQGVRATPKFDGTDEWPLLSVPDVKTTEAYVAVDQIGGTFVGQFSGSFVIPLHLFGDMDPDSAVQVRIQDPLITMQFSADRQHVDLGVIAGYVNAKELSEQAIRAVSIFDPSLCGGPTASLIGNQVFQSADILLDGKVDQSRECDFVSIGIQFEATRAVRGAYTDPPPPQKDPCSTP